MISSPNSLRSITQIQQGSFDAKFEEFSEERIPRWKEVQIKNEMETMLYFDSCVGLAKGTNRHNLEEFLNKFPKCGLHSHLSGCVYAETFIELASKHDFLWDFAKQKFTKTEGEKTTPVSELVNDFQWYDHVKQLMSIENINNNKKATSSSQGHTRFYEVFPVFEEVIDCFRDDPVVLGSIIKRAQKCNVIYNEIKTELLPHPKLPEDYLKKFNCKDMTSALSYLEKSGWITTYVRSAKKILDEFDKVKPELENNDSRIRTASNGNYVKKSSLSTTDFPLTDIRSPVVFRFINEFMRTQTNPNFFAHAAGAFELMRNDPRVCSLDMVGPEHIVGSRLNFSQQVEMLKFLKENQECKGHIPKLTMHAGELTNDLLDDTFGLNPISRLIDLGVHRLGHCVAINSEPGGAEEICRRLKEADICVEVCLTTNLIILGVKGAKHPIGKFDEEGVSYTLNVDDEGVVRTNLTMEYQRGVLKHELDYLKLKNISRRGVHYSFTSGMSIYEKKNDTENERGFLHLKSPFNKVDILKWLEDPLTKDYLDPKNNLFSEKAYLGYRMELMILDFESYYALKNQKNSPKKTGHSPVSSSPPAQLQTF
jgi:adenosine deaminase